MSQHHKDESIGGTMYRIGKLSATDGAWVAILLTAKMREAAQKEAEKAPKPSKRIKASTEPPAPVATPIISYEEGMMMSATFLVAQLSRTELAEVQAMCLARCFIVEEMAGVPVPVAVRNEMGHWANEDLEMDGPVILELTKRSLAFNIAPFFPAPALNQ